MIFRLRVSTVPYFPVSRGYLAAAFKPCLRSVHICAQIAKQTLPSRIEPTSALSTTRRPADRRADCRTDCRAPIPAKTPCSGGVDATDTGCGAHAQLCRCATARRIPCSQTRCTPRRMGPHHRCRHGSVWYAPGYLPAYCAPRRNRPPQPRPPPW